MARSREADEEGDTRGEPNARFSGVLDMPI